GIGCGRTERPLSLSRFVVMPENRSASAAVQQVADSLCVGSRYHAPNPLYLHGVAGTGKSYLVASLIAEVTQRSRQVVVTVLQASEFETLARPRERGSR